MNPKIVHITNVLKKARETQKLSQRELAKKVGLPQSHISKIENAQVDLKTSSLIEISRTLNYEPMLIPRRLITTIRAIINAKPDKESKPAYQLEPDEDEE